MPWSKPHDLLVASPAQPGTPYFLGTSRPEGRPNAASLGAAWLDGDLYFTSGPDTRKARNLASNPACTFAVGLEGIDLVLEGEVATPWHLYLFTFHTAFGVATAEPYGATRWRFQR